MSYKPHGSENPWVEVVSHQLGLSTTISDLESETLYTIRLSAHNIMGEGDAFHPDTQMKVITYVRGHRSCGLLCLLDHQSSPTPPDE